MTDERTWRDRAMRALWEHSPDLVSVIGYDDRGDFVLVDCNDQVTEGTGWARDELIGVPMTQLLPPDEAQEQIDQMQQVFTSGDARTFEVQREVPSGRRSYRYTMFPLLGEDGRVERALALSRDITEQRAAETALLDTQGIARVGHWSWDLVADETTWSAGLYQVFGVDPDEFEPSLDNVLGLLSEEDAQRLSELIVKTLEQGEAFTFQHDITLPSGEVRHAEARAELVRAPDGTPIRLAGTTQDVTAVRQVEVKQRALEEARRSQEQAVELNDDVLQGLSVAALALEMEDVAAAEQAVHRTIDAVREIISDLLSATREGETRIGPGDLVREHAAGWPS